MILNDKQIKKLVEDKKMISPFVDRSVQQGISYGLQSFGYDLRVGSEFKIFTNIKGNAIADPKNFTEDNFITVKEDKSVILAKNEILKEIKNDEYYELIKNFIKDYRQFRDKNLH